MRCPLCGNSEKADYRKDYGDRCYCGDCLKWFYIENPSTIYKNLIKVEDVVNNVKVFIEYGKNKYDFSLDDKSSRAFNRNEPI